MCLFDWEFCEINLPQRDLCMFLAHTICLNPAPHREVRDVVVKYVDFYREKLCASLAATCKDTPTMLLGSADFLEVFDYCMVQYFVDRLMDVALLKVPSRNFEERYAGLLRYIEGIGNSLPLRLKSK